MSRFFNPTVMSTLFAVLASSFIAVSASAQQSREVKAIDPPVSTPNDGTIEVLEFFSYGCIACANLEPALDDWAKTLPADVKFRRVPSGFNFMGIDDIAVFHTLEAMGQLDRLNKKIFEAAHNERVMLGHRPTYLKWLEKQGVNAAQYESIEKSFSVQSKIMRGRGLASLYKVTSTPTIVVDGRMSAQQYGEAKFFLTGTIDQLINQARIGKPKSQLPVAAVAGAAAVGAGVAAKAAVAKKAPPKTSPKAASAKAAPAAPVTASPTPTPAPSK
jgi:protein dithiol oxidoreductase (disulfide-forming)